MPPLNRSSVVSKLAFWCSFLALVAQTWALALHIPIPVTDDGIDKPGGRFSFGKPFHIIWDLDDDGESGKLTFIAEPMVGPSNFTLVENVDVKDREVYTSLAPPRPWPESDTYFIHAANASDLKQILYTTSNIWIFDDKPATTTLVITSGSQTTAASTSQVPLTQATTTRSSNSAPPGTSPILLTTSTSTSKSSSVSTSITQSSTNSSTVLPSSTTAIATSSDDTITKITATSTNTAVSIPPTTTPLAATSNPSSPRNAIIGGVIGGVSFLLLLVIALLFCRRRRQHKKSQLAVIPVAIVPSNYSPPPSKFGVLPTNRPLVPQWPPAGMAEVPRERHKTQAAVPQWPSEGVGVRRERHKIPAAVPQWPPEGTEVPREGRKFQPGLEGAPAPPTPPAPQGDTPDVENDADSEEDARRLRTQAEAMNERIAELESQLVRGLDIGGQPPGYVSQRQSVAPR